MEIIAGLTNDLEPISRLANRMLAEDLPCGSAHGRLQLSERPHVGEEAYAVTLFMGVETEVIERYQILHKIEIPESYREILRMLNGANLFRLNLYGLPASMTKDPPLLDRTEIQPLDLATANRNWRHPFTADGSLFQIGGGPWSASENLGYFLSSDGGVRALRKQDLLVSSWSSVEKFLEDELPRVEAQYPEFEKLMAQLRANTE